MVMDSGSPPWFHSHKENPSNIQYFCTGLSEIICYLNRSIIPWCNAVHGRHTEDNPEFFSPLKRKQDIPNEENTNIFLS